MSQQKQACASSQINASVAARTIITAPLGVGNPPDITKLILANTSATGTLVNVSDGVNNYYFNVAAGATIMVDGLQSDVASTAWTVTCATSINSLYVTATYD